MADGKYISLDVHHEDDTWWCDSPEIPGFYGAADTRDELIGRCHLAVQEILADQGETLGTFVWCHVHENALIDGSDGG
jgi:predicted RNase H-like HicB family nuclease